MLCRQCGYIHYDGDLLGGVLPEINFYLEEMRVRYGEEERSPELQAPEKVENTDVKGKMKRIVK